MARIRLLDEDDDSTPEEARELLRAAKDSRGRLMNLYRALANHPSAMAGFTAPIWAVYGAGSSLSRRQTELAYTTATVVNNCYY